MVVGEQEPLKLFHNNMNRINLKSGISLIETVVYIAIFSLFVVALAQFSTTLTSTRMYTQSVLEVNNQGSQVMRLITQTLRNGSSVNNPTIGNTSSILSVVAHSPMIDPTVFSLSDGVIYITEGSMSPIALTNNKVVVSDLVFSNFSRIGAPSIIKVTFTINSSQSQYPYSTTFDGSGAIRK